MTVFQKISFVYPYSLILLIFLPFLIRFLITSPLLPKLKKFPSIIFLANYKSIDQKSAKLNYPIIILRLLIILFLIFAFSNPIFSSGNTKKSSDLIIIDNGWTSGTIWNVRKQKIIELLSAKEIKNQEFFLLTTTELANEKLSNYNSKNFAEAINFVKSIKPLSWSPNYKNVKRSVEDRIDSFDKVYWFTEKTINTEKSNLLNFLKNYNLTIVASSENEIPPVLKVFPENDTTYKIEIHHYKKKFTKGTINCFDEEQRLIFRQKFEQKIVENEDTFTTKFELKLPYQIKDKIFYFQLDDINSVSTKFFLNRLRQKKVIGIVNDKKNEVDFQRGSYYTRKGVEKNNVIIEEGLSKLLTKSVSSIFIDDSNSTNNIKEQTLSWIKSGGIMIKYGGPNLLSTFADNPNNIFLNKLSLSKIETTLDSKLSLKKNLKIKEETDEEEFFFGIKIPNEIVVKKYIQLDISYLTNDVEVLLRLENGAPIISSSKVGSGRIIFFHIPVNNLWSNFPLSYSFIEIIQRIINLSKGIDEKKERIFQPYLSLDAIGNFLPASAQVLSVNNFKPSNSIVLNYNQPPGIYKDYDGFIAVNFGNNFSNSYKFKNLGSNLNFEELITDKSISLRPILLTLAILFFLIDTLITLYLRGLIRFDYLLRIFPKVFMIIFITLISKTIIAKDISKDKISETKIGYILTNNSLIDENSRNGLMQISKFVSKKTASILNKPEGINLQNQELFYYPLIYWPLINTNIKLSSEESKKINSFLKDGGLLLVDCKLNFSTFDLDNCLAKFKDLVKISELSKFSKLGKNHGIAKSFYLIENFPGVENNEVFFSKVDSQFNDNAASVVLSNNNWSNAWAKDSNENFIFPLLDNSENQRITSIRFGINLVIYALTGNYKADQIHVPEILKRLKK